MALAEYQLVLSKVPYLVESPIALLLATMGKRAEARTMLAGLEHPKSGYVSTRAFDIAEVYAR